MRHPTRRTSPRRTAPRSSRWYGSSRRHGALTAGNLTGQALAAGLVDEVSVSMAPVVFGSGVRFFGDYGGSPVPLDNPQVVYGDRVTHLHYRVSK